MLLLIILSFEVFHDIRIGGIGLLALSYGDGFAALAGKRFNYVPFEIWGNKKTLSGSIAMFLVTFVSVSIYLCITQLQVTLLGVAIPAFWIAIVSTASELITPFGIDNLAIPISAVLVYYLFW